MLRPVFVVSLSFWLLSSQRAMATGLCEDNPLRYEDKVSYAAATKQLAFKGSQAVCEEKDKGGDLSEERRNLRFLEIRDLAGAVVKRLSSARGRDGEHLEKLVGAFEHVPAKKLDAALAERGFKPLPAHAASPAGGCKVTTTFTKDPEKQNGFPAAKVAVVVTTGDKRGVGRVEAGVAARERRSDLALRAIFLPEEQAVAVWVRVPQCVGGPPPGHFGPDDAGSCYSGDEIVIKVLPLAKHPDLAACFAAPAAPAK